MSVATLITYFISRFYVWCAAKVKSLRTAGLVRCETKETDNTVQYYFRFKIFRITYIFMRNFRLPPLSKWELRSYELLHSE